MIALKNITKRYGELTVYKDFNFCIEDGKTTCVLGESGSGKSTLLNIIAALTPFSGTIAPVPKCSYVFQEPRLVPNLTVAGNLRLVCKDDAKVAEMLVRVGLLDRAKSYPAQLSGGQAQRVSLARAFLYPSDIILMDEPFSSLDLGLKLRMTELFLELKERTNRTSLFVTHDADEALMTADRIVVLKGGKVCREFIPSGSPCADLFARSCLRSELVSALL